MQIAYIKSATLTNDGLWEVTFEQFQDALTLHMTAFMSDDSLSRMSKAFRVPTPESGNRTKFLKVRKPNQLLAGYLLDAKFSESPFPSIRIPVPLHCPIIKIQPADNGCVVWVHCQYLGYAQAIMVPNMSFEEMLSLFGESTFNSLNNYLKQSEAVASVYSESCIYLPIPIPVERLEAMVIL